MIKVRTQLKIKKVENTAIERHPVPVLGKDYRVKIIYKNIKDLISNNIKEAYYGI